MSAIANPYELLLGTYTVIPNEKAEFSTCKKTSFSHDLDADFLTFIMYMLIVIPKFPTSEWIEYVATDCFCFVWGYW